MKNMLRVLLLFCFAGINHFYSIAQSKNVEVWLTSPDKSALLQKQAKTFSFEKIDNLLPTTFVDETKSFQKMDGFGFTLTGGSATLINQMGIAEKNALLKELFTTNANNIGVSYLKAQIISNLFFKPLNIDVLCAVADVMI
jgi:glucosylceramidase